MKQQPSDGASSEAERLFADFLASRPAGEAAAACDAAFEELCAAHRDQAEALRRLHGQWRQLAGVLDRLGLSDAPGRYRLKGEVARGGMGAILRVWDTDLRRNLAMKVILGKALPSESSDTPAVDSRSLGRFLEEAQITGQLDHPGIVPVHELGLDEHGRVFFTMKLVKGEDLKHVFERVAAGEQGFSTTRVLGQLLKLCEAMAYAHAKGVIHRDLKPSNVMVGKYGEVYVMDWGLARVLDEADAKDIRIRPEGPTATTDIHSERHEHAAADPDSPLFTMDGDIVGTPAYMPPEQAQGDLASLGPASDVYLGVVGVALLEQHDEAEERVAGQAVHQAVGWVAFNRVGATHQS